MSLLGRRSAGLLVPLASIRTGREWGVGEYADLPAFAGWAHTGGFSMVMTLPLLEPSPGQESPYSSCSFFALDPLYVRVLDVPEIEELGGERMLETSERERLERVRAAPKVLHDEVRALKDGVLRRAHERFVTSVDAASAPARDLARFEDEHRAWLADYALFRALKHAHPESWRSWPEPIRDARPDAIDEARRAHGREIRFRTWLQWIAFRQHERARAQAKALGISLAGDEPFLVADDSADVWSRQDRFRFDATVGAPPDAFSADGQEWGLPPYRWEKIAEERFELFAQRGKHTSRLYDLVRIDHVVGLYRTYHRPIDKSAHYFWPEDEASQREQGEAVLRAFGAAGTEVIAEDLGVIPDFVRESLGRLGIPGYRVLRWEKVHDRKFRDPATWPPLSVATTGTHDTETSIEWWEGLPAWEREAVREIPTLKGLSDERAARWCEDVHAALLETVYASPSRLALVPVQDVLALRDRINTPNTVGPENWSWRMPWTVPAMHDDAIVRGRMSATRRLAQRTTRTTDGG
jgi:4-alpha-glucanotransferase